MICLTFKHYVQHTTSRKETKQSFAEPIGHKTCSHKDYHQDKQNDGWQNKKQNRKRKMVFFEDTQHPAPALIRTDCRTKVQIPTERGRYE
jgi:hypothetical protein